MSESPFPTLEGSPYFNHETGSMLIEGSHDIIPAEPLRIGNERQLLLDKHVVDTTWNCFRRVHQPKKHEANPLIPGGEMKPEGFTAPANWGTVMYDEETGRFRFWTSLWDTTRDKYDMDRLQVYWESEDGVEWTAPELGIIELDGSKANNVIQGKKGLNYSTPSVVEVPERLHSKGLYAMVFGCNTPEFPAGIKHSMQDRIAWSDDGLSWREQPENPIFVGRNDTFVNMEYNPDRDVFMQYRRAAVNSHEIRRVAYTESEDLVSWTQPEVIIDVDELDAGFLYDFTVMSYHGVYLGLLHPLYTGNGGYVGTRLWRYGCDEKSGQTDVQLCWSRDGKTWDRHPERPIFIENGPHAPETSYDWGLIYACKGIIERGDELYLYYRGDGALHFKMPGTIGNFCLATLRKDGFVSLGTLGYTDSPGYMLTRPLHCPGGKLRINAKTEEGGSIRVAVRRGDGVHDGNWVEGWHFADMDPFRGDTTNQVVEWSDHADFDGVEGHSIRLHFWLERAELYSFWFD